MGEYFVCELNNIKGAVVVMRKFLIAMVAVNCVFMVTNAYAMQELNKALRDAAKAGDVRQVRKLINQKAEVNHYWSIAYDNFDNAYAGDERSPLIYASMGGHVAVVKELLAARAVVHSKDYHIDLYARHALSKACENGHVEVVRVLLAGGIEPKGCLFSDTPLMRAVRFNRLEVVKTLCAAKADVNEESEGDRVGGRVALIYAMWCKNSEIANELIRAGADVNRSDDEWNSALDVVVGFRSNPRTKDMARVLVLAGASYHEKNKKGQTAWDLADAGMREVIKQAEQERKALIKSGVVAQRQDEARAILQAAFTDEDGKEEGVALAVEGAGASKESKQENVKRRCIIS